MRAFLGWIIDHDGSLNPSQDLRAIAEELGWQPGFAEVLFTSARSRGLVHQVPVRGGRGRVYWSLSERGVTWLNHEASRDGQVAAVAHASVQ